MLRNCILAGFLALAGTVHADDDSIRVKLTATKAACEAAMEKAKADLLADYDKRIATARQTGNRDAVKAIQTEKEAFEKGGDAPKSQVGTAYRTSMERARKDLLAAYDLAIKDYTKAANDAAADALAAERKAAAEAVGKSAKSAEAAKPVKYLPGLLVREYPKQKSQFDSPRFVEPEKLTEPVGEPRVVTTLNWKYNGDRNAMATGFLKIDKEGEYAFNSNNFYDRNALYVEDKDKPLCKFQDGEEKIVTIALKPGYVPIISVGSVDARGTVHVKWMPPGNKELGDVPANVLFYAPPAPAKK